MYLIVSAMESLTQVRLTGAMTDIESQTTTDTAAPILVTGGTGKTGRRVAARLAARGIPVRVGSRTGSPCFDWGDPATWDSALRGAAATYVVYYPDLAFPGAADTLGAFAAAAARHAVRRLVLLSGRGEEEAVETERAVQAAFPDATVLRASWFAQNFSEHFLLGPVLDGVIALPAGDVPEPFVDVEDIADVAVAALTRDGHAGATYELTGPRALGFAEAAAEIARAAGRPVAYVPVTPDEYRVAALAAGVPAEEVEPLTELFTRVLDGRNATATRDVDRVLGRPARDFADYVAAAAASGVWAA
jgi:uncharacterized protein YbjT (DUF2867 family)